LNTGNGHDNVYVGFTEIGSNFITNLGGGKDNLNIAYVHVGAGGVAGSAIFNAGSGHDQIFVNGLYALQNFFANLGSGDDCISVYASRANNLARFLGGQGNDGRDFAYNDFGNFHELQFEFWECFPDK
jgi:hypothetical protein